MPQASQRRLRFVRALLQSGRACRGGELFRTIGDAGVTLPTVEVAVLASDGVLSHDGDSCVPGSETRNWLRRQQFSGEEPYGRQHREEVPRPDGGVRNIAESPLARLAASTGGASAFLEPHQVEAGERLRRLVERAQLRPRVTMSYDAAHTASRGGAGQAAEIGEMAADARRQLATLFEVLPRDCAEVTLDVCGLEKGLQLIETERGWPRRSAKLVLRIALDQLARHFGLSPVATGTQQRRNRSWMDGDARLPMSAAETATSGEGLRL